MHMFELYVVSKSPVRPSSRSLQASDSYSTRDALPPKPFFSLATSTGESSRAASHTRPGMLAWPVCLVHPVLQRLSQVSVTADLSEALQEKAARLKAAQQAAAKERADVALAIQDHWATLKPQARPTLKRQKGQKDHCRGM
jgi:hypothetical protein